MMIPGSWEPRQQSADSHSIPPTSGPVAAVPHVSDALGTQVEPRVSRAEPATWLKVSIFAAALLAVTIIAMWASGFATRTADVPRQHVTDTER